MSLVAESTFVSPPTAPSIAILSQDNFAIAYADGSSDRSLSNGGAGILLLLPDGNNYKHKINIGIIASNFTSELMAIRKALILYQQDPHVIDSTEGLVFSNSKSVIEAIRNGETNISCDIITLLEQLHNKRKSCILQWIPAHVNIEETDPWQQALENPELFGGDMLIPHGAFLGEIYIHQVPPVRSTPIYKQPKQTIVGQILWRNLKFYENEVIHQAIQQFSSILTKIGNSEQLDEIEITLIES
ncbi:ATP-dependent DNA helicase [Trichonephila clavipes]|nr:ATP-dependent DNA helicase [Trichonephila clavipes]